MDIEATKVLSSQFTYEEEQYLERLLITIMIAFWFFGILLTHYSR